MRNCEYRANQRAAEEQQTVAELQQRVNDLEVELGSLRGECQQLESDLDGAQEKAEREREAVGMRNLVTTVH